MAMLELTNPQPNWLDALGVALTRPPGTPERRAGEDPMAEPPDGRPRRVSDDLAWLRQALDEPERHGLHQLDDTAAVSAWRPEEEETVERLCRLRDRGVLDAAGFLLHESSEVGPPPS